MPGKHEVKPETWRKWVRLVLESIKEPIAIEDLYSKLKDKGVAQKRVDSILTVLEEAGVIRSEGNKISLRIGEVSGVGEARREEYPTTMESMDCVYLSKLGIESKSGSKLYFCSKYEITIGEEAEVCFVCRYRTPRSGGG
ncbi:MAG: hypothetical protein RMJ00_03455 [Nitrososphaerota archaeon]|nr:hypothetical protein [Candidatus Bathyarchaeota archaeon]MDW8061735.1 hypothetical protein [Nitrososphaerota archaeon]